MPSVIVFSHLRWDFVFQRPQHLVTRIARTYPVLFIEEPVFDPGPAYMELRSPSPNVLVCRPHTSVRAAGFHDDQLPALQLLLEKLLDERGIRNPIAWLYTPMALPLLQHLDPRTVVYDCMDELSAFLNAPRQLLQRESGLLIAADVVFTGGLSLFRSKQSRHPAVYCFPSSVEREHFAQGRDSANDHSDQLSLEHPRLGFFGVIDERVDLGLLAHLADAHPEWQIVLVGPIVKIDPASVPRRSNIHYFGQRSYAELPQFLAGWDVCLLPFAMNESTRFISPTKTLEYMAAEKPIVSTPVPDVLEPYGAIVDVTGNPAAFTKACEKALEESVGARAARVQAMRETVDGTSWDSTAEQMLHLVEEAAGIAPAAPAILAKPAPSISSHERAIVIGAGPTGLSAAYHLGEDALLLEQNETVGGWCRSIRDGGFTFDYAGHIMFSNDPYVHQLYQMLLGENVHWQNREAWIYSKQVYTRYPFQGALFGLPSEVLKECLVGAIEARFGPLKKRTGPTSQANGSAINGSGPAACKAESITDCCADGIAESTVPLSIDGARSGSRSEPRNFEEFIYSVWGSGVAKHFAVPYNRKLWAVPLAEMETSWLGGRVPLPDLEEMIEGALRPVSKPVGPNARFGYPLRGGFQALVDGFLPRLEGKLQLGARVAQISPSAHEVVLNDGTAYTYEQLISTMPLPTLVNLVTDEVPVAVRRAANELRHVSVRCVNLGIARADVTDKHWIYYPEDSVFHRIFVQGNASPHVNAAGGFALTCEITYSPQKPLPCDGDELVKRCIQDCINVGLLRSAEEVIVSNQIDMPFAYVVYDHARAENVRTIREWLGRQDIVLAGRYSEWEYYNSDHAFIAGKKAADTVLTRLGEQQRAPMRQRVSRGDSVLTDCHDAR
jgi:UDP-galactopyranose mutase